ncbi:MAG TPA: DM13 domain-containing protein, partial [Actinomycetota bacterium]|nr:DM13 domain-containing protein [Actinomycetota bacterium]
AAQEQTSPSSDEDSSSAAETMVLAEGSFQSLEHETKGRAVLLEVEDGQRYLRFEDLATSNGPDLRVYLSEIPASDDWYAYGRRFVDLGALKGNLGNQNYALPDEIDLSKYKSAVIWCRRFTVGFGVAPLEPA